jgi:TetR/AcrR family transcriptional repressor of nem operon
MTMESTMREQIKSLAVDLLVQHGYRGFNFRDIAEGLGTTRANLHYHFGNKDRLVLEVLDEYATSTVAFYESIWTDPGTSLRTKVHKTVEHARQRYRKLNTPKDIGAPWSLLIRLRSDADALTPLMQQILQNTTREFEQLVRMGVRLAIHSGELRSETPEEDVTVILATIIHYAGSVTRDHKDFQRLEKLWEAAITMVEEAYSGSGAAPSARE